jgi:threonine synthase
VVPRDTPAPIVEEIRALGADLTLIEGSIMDCGALVRRGVDEHGWWDLSTLREPYRIEGKKTMAYELFEQLGGRLPDAIVFPTGGGTGLIGMWKAFEEMAALGWTGKARPRMFAVQATGCAPLVRAWEKGADHFSKWGAPRTYASGIRVPAAIGDFLMLRVLRESNGGAVAVSDAEMERGVELLGSETGMFAAPEGGAAVAALAHFSASGAIGPKDEVVVFNTGSGLKYVGARPGS